MMSSSFHATRLLAALVGLVTAAPAIAAPLTPTTVALFDPTRLETPESIVVDHQGNRYISMALTGEIRKIAADGAQSTLAWLPVGPPLTPCGPFIGIMGALALDPQGSVYANVAACDPVNRGIWRVTSEGVASRVVPMPPEALPNGIAWRANQLYVADSNLSIIWRVPADGSAPATVWLDNALLKPRPQPVFPGPNGLQIFQNDVYVAVSDTGIVVRVPIGENGAAGTPVKHADAACDDFAFDVAGNLYCGTDPFNTLLRVAQDGTVDVILTAADGLDGPTAAAFGRIEGERDVLYVTNAAFPFFSTAHRPSLMKVTIGIPGMPRM